MRHKNSKIRLPSAMRFTSKVAHFRKLSIRHRNTCAWKEVSGPRWSGHDQKRVVRILSTSTSRCVCCTCANHLNCFISLWGHFSALPLLVFSFQPIRGSRWCKFSREPLSSVLRSFYDFKHTRVLSWSMARLKRHALCLVQRPTAGVETGHQFLTPMWARYFLNRGNRNEG